MPTLKQLRNRQQITFGKKRRFPSSKRSFPAQNAQVNNCACLKDKWFIDTNASGGFPPQVRHPGSLVGDHTDGNLVTPLIDGINFMGYFDVRMQELMNADDPTKSELWLAAMGIEGVRLRGGGSDSRDAMTTLKDAARAGVKISFMASGQGGLAFGSRKFAKELIGLGSQATVDDRSPFVGGHHQKFYITYKPENDWQAVVGSADFFLARWDDREHLPENPNRPKGPTHDMAALVQGPATVDVALTFAERWNDLKTNKRTHPPITRALGTAVNDPPTPAGSHSVQVLRTFPIVKNGHGYTWSDVGEYTIWAAYLNAIKQAQTYIYLEDQYLYSFGDPPVIYNGSGVKRETDYVYQMGEAIKRGVDVVALVPGRDDSIAKHYEIQHRRRTTEYLANIANSQSGAGRFVVAKPAKGGKDITVHSKLMLVDDEYALIGSANVCQRSIAYITEIQLGIVDAENQFVRDLRLDLWQEHMELSGPDSILDPRKAVGLFHENAEAGKGRLHSYPTTRFRREFPYRVIMNRLIDPYSGPERR